MNNEKLTTAQKAARINRDAGRYGTFAEIGAGQEVARWFFHVGGAAGTVAKTISAYDMQVSDAIYGPSDRYVSRSRLKAMLDYEFNLLIERLDASRGDKSTFFVFADTVATSSFTRKEEGHGWLGLKFQTQPRGEPSEIFIHVRMLDHENVRQQEALGIIGVNLIHGAVYSHDQPEAIIESLLDQLSWERIEVDMIRFGGAVFSGVDDRLMALQLVKQGLTEAAMFTADGKAAQWAEVLYKKPVLVQRGSFRPVTNATLAVLDRACAEFVSEPELQGESPVVLMEMTLRHLTSGDAIDHRDFLHRAEMLGALGRTVLISNFRRFHRLSSYLARYTDRPIAHAIGASKLPEIFNAAIYNDAEGGILGGLGQLVKNASRVYVHPALDFQTGDLMTAKNLRLPETLAHLHAHLVANRWLRDLKEFDPAVLRVRSRDVLEKIAARDASWEKFVPVRVVEVIKRQKLFGWQD
jgi:hypothetical protein